MRPLRSFEAYQAARDFAALMEQDPLEAIGMFIVRSKTRRDVTYEMMRTPDGYAVHQGEGCEGEKFNGPLGCWHSRDFTVARKDEDMTQAMTTYQGDSVTAYREYTSSDIDTLKATICAGASDSELKLFVATCQHTGLDPFMKQIYAIMRRSKVGNDWVEKMTIQVGIDGFRLVANRTGQMDGMEGPQWTYDGKTWEDLPWDTEPPIAARVAVYRRGIKTPFVSVCRWKAYVQTVSSGEPNAMWSRMGPEMLAKCAEALALRRAFPAEMAALPVAPDFVDDDEEEERPVAFIEHEGPASAGIPTPVPSVAHEAPVQEPVTPAPTSPDEAAADRKEITRLVKELQGVWSADEVQALGRELKQYLPDPSQRFVVSALSADAAAAALGHVRSAIAQRAAVEAAVAEDAALEALDAEDGALDNEPAHAAVMKYTPGGRAFCEVCGEAVNEQTGEHMITAAPAQEALI